MSFVEDRQLKYKAKSVERDLKDNHVEERVATDHELNVIEMFYLNSTLNFGYRQYWHSS